MIRIVLVYGALAGIATIIAMIVGLEMSAGPGSGTGSEAVGYLIMLVACSFIFVGIKRFRDVEQGGVITFSKGVAVGALMAAVATLCYTAIWEVYLALTDYAFIDNYLAGILEAKKAEGVTGEELQAVIDTNAGWKETLSNPFIRVPVTFTEIFPLALLIAIISAAILRKSEVLPAQR